ncbi:MbtH family protein [Streptomyces marianii]|uniref:MbtH family NRPS accessory protein n=1 Tax=Streptomyces marianii TaxID=1817406 RepID=A0A5R9E3Y1_9ACTN|nr:MbtH family NRPS accessory protein [Streptomyces marianii]TLQ44536.1 MbtH family NRPS accessory protein [Streptomyces marianii]
MPLFDEDDMTITYLVVVNHEEQHSIWPTGRDIPDGWLSTGFTGKIDACLAEVERVWTDMRPLSLRKAMDTAAVR